MDIEIPDSSSGGRGAKDLDVGGLVITAKTPGGWCDHCEITVGHVGLDDLKVKLNIGEKVVYDARNDGKWEIRYLRQTSGGCVFRVTLLGAKG